WAPSLIDDAVFDGPEDIGSQADTTDSASAERTTERQTMSASPDIALAESDDDLSGRAARSAPQAHPAQVPSRTHPTAVDVPAVSASNILEHDVLTLSTHLALPGTPAIVRSDVLAEQLGLGLDRCERALERLTEQRDRISRIRKGAYMIRRDATHG